MQTWLIKCRWLIVFCILISVVNIGFIIVFLPTNDVRKNESIIVEIWSKSAIGQYFWENIFDGNIESKLMTKNELNHLYMEGWKTIDSVRFHFRTGPSLKPESYRSFRPKNLVLILNWRSNDKINYSNKWLRTIFEDPNNVPSNVGIIALGNESCNNTWFTDHMKNYPNLRFLFLVYDSTLVDNQLIYQWPLGVATYRNFPSTSVIDIHSSRPYVCNFVATIYPNSSRQELYNLFTKNDWNHKCLIKTRSKWIANENIESMNNYVEALHSSDLTLCPAGLNVECYRILEAVEYGSIPVIEESIINHHNVQNKNQCDRQQVLRLFKQFNAPFHYVQNWTEQLPELLAQYNAMDLRELIRRRINLIKWYYRFRIHLRNHFVNVLKEKFV